MNSNYTEKALELFADNKNCSQAVFASFGPQFNLSEEQCLKIGAAFGGGIARKQLTCGAVTGAAMALGLKYGDDKELCYTKTQDFFAKFENIHGSINCKQLLKYDMNTDEGKAEIEKKELFTTACPKFVETATKIIEELM